MSAAVAMPARAKVEEVTRCRRKLAMVHQVDAMRLIPDRTLDHQRCRGQRGKKTKYGSVAVSLRRAYPVSGNKHALPLAHGWLSTASRHRP